MDKLKIFSGNANLPLAKRMCDYLGIALGNAYVGRFPDGEIDVKVDEDVRGSDTFVVQPTCPPVNENMMELLILIDCLRRASAQRITAVIPYYGYARKDRKDEGRVPITAKLVANLITRAGADRVLALDLHASQVQGFFDIPTDHLFAFPVLTDYYQKLSVTDLVIAAPDVGGVKLARAYAKVLSTDMVIVDKRRMSPQEAAVGFVIGSVEGKNVLMVDDLVATGGTLAEAAKALKARGARDIYVSATHPVFCGPVVERLKPAPIKEVTVTDTIQLNDKAKALGDRIRVLSIGELLGEAIRRIHLNKSVSSLFNKEV